MPYSEPLQVYPPSAGGYLQPAVTQEALHYNALVSSSMPAPQDLSKLHDVFSTPPQVRPSLASVNTWKSDVASSTSSTSLADDLGEAMGELKIDHLGSSTFWSVSEIGGC